MKLLLLFAFALPLLATAQPAANEPAGTLHFENGVIANGTYSNECLGFSLPIPAGWKIDESIIAGGKARHRSEKSLVLLFLRQEGNPIGRIILSASVPDDETSTAQDFVSSAVHEQIKASPDRELVRDTAPVDYGGQHFYRADYKGLLGGKEPLYFAYVYTKFRGYVIGETVVSGSPQGLDAAANSLQPISFQQDEVNPKCVMAPDESASKNAQPQRVRISPGVATGLLVKKVTPEYPADARQARIQGTVILQAVIDKDGNVADLSLVSGHPMLAPAAIRAVKQWKYKPYLLNGVPMPVETQVTVNFTLSEF
ncbi:MAG: energy transducer TonB [Terriglobales bacterium]